jgi:hypothetical protein
MESNQIVLQLTENKDILAQLRKNKALKRATPEAPEVFTAQYDGKVFSFRKGVPVTLSASAAKALRRSSAVIVGASIDGEYMPALEMVDEFQLGEESATRRKSLTMCPICLKDMKNIPNLAKHLSSKAHKEDRPDLFTATAEDNTNEVDGTQGE